LEHETITLSGTANLIESASDFHLYGSAGFQLIDNQFDSTNCPDMVTFYGVCFDNELENWWGVFAFVDDNPTNSPSDVATVTAKTAGPYGIATEQRQVTVDNVAPVLTLTADKTEIFEGNEVRLTISFTDPGTEDGHTVVVDWGSGEGSQTVTFEPVAAEDQPSRHPYDASDQISETFTLTRVYLDDNPSVTSFDNYTISVVVTDDDTGNDDDTHALKVKNVDPTVTVFSVTPIDSVPMVQGGVVDRLDETEGFTVSGTVIDPGIEDTFPVAELRADIDFDGAIEANEKFPLTMVRDPYDPSLWTFSATVNTVPDDGATYDGNGQRMWGNELCRSAF